MFGTPSETVPFRLFQAQAESDAWLQAGELVYDVATLGFASSTCRILELAVIRHGGGALRAAQLHDLDANGARLLALTCPYLPLPALIAIIQNWSVPLEEDTCPAAHPQHCGGKVWQECRN